MHRSGTAFILGLMGMCCAPQNELHKASSHDDHAIQSETSVLPFRHPLLNARQDAQRHGLASGLLPLFDVKDSPSGGRFAISEGVDVAADGTTRTESGVVTLDSVVDPRPRKKGHREPVASPATRLDEDLSARLTMTKPNERIAVEVTVSRGEETRVTVTDRINRAIALGKIANEEDVVSVRSAAIDERQKQVLQQQQTALELVASLGGKIIARHRNLHGFTAELATQDVPRLLAEPSIVRIDGVERLVDESPTGVNLREGQQLNQFLNDGFNGERGSNSDVSFALVEGGAIDETLYAYRDDVTPPTRIRSMWECDDSNCGEVSAFAGSPSGHTTAVASILFGSLEEGQDPSVTNQTERIMRSGFATEAKGYFYRKNGESTPALESAIDAIAGITSYAPILANMSFGTTSPSCSGQDNASRAVNELFESGTLTFKSAGNTGHSSSTTCTVTSPGAAIGAFTVGAYGDTTSGTTADVRVDNACPDTARGNPDVRSIVDIAAYAPRSLVAGAYNVDVTSGCFTSYAAPAAAGAAIDFADHYFYHNGSFLEDPGLLFVSMLLMGDRFSDYNGAYLTSQFDSLYGAGRMKMRRWDTVGLDAPSGYRLGSTCVDNGKTYTIHLADGATLSPDVDAIKAAIYWYDRRHADGTLDDIDLELWRGSTLVEWSNKEEEEKERVVYLGVPSAKYDLKIIGYNVTSDEAGCGTNSMRVYYAFFYEDSDRDDAEGPGPEIVREQWPN